MRELFADTFFWTALADPQDRWHRAAREFDASVQGFVERKSRTDRKAFDRIMNREGGVPSQPGDELA